MQANNKRIAKNTMMLYLRMLIVTLVGLYTTRIVMSVLGVSDYGVYTVVGGITAMFGFLKTSMSTSTSRFLSYDLGTNNLSKLRDTFSTAFILHLIIAIIVAILTLTVGIWFLENKLSIPDGRMDAAKWVLYCTVISAAFTITQVPYNSMIIAYEKMGIYAYIEIVNVVLKLVIVYLLTIGKFDKLELYAVLSLSVTIIISIIYRLYCIKKLKGSKLKWIWDKTIIKELLKFSSWSMFGSVSMTAKQQGQNFLMNIFYGVRLNAALGISDMLYGTLTSMSYNMLTAFNPQIVKTYANGDYNGMNSLITNAIKMSFLMLAVLSVPFIINIEFILHLWLTDIPPYVAQICAIALIFNSIGVVNSVFSLAINAHGSVRNKSIITGCSMLIGLVILWVVLKLNLPIQYAFVAFYIGTPIMLILTAIEAKRLLPFIPAFKLIWKGMMLPAVLSLCIFAVTYVLKSRIANEVVALICTTVLSTVLFVICTYAFLLNYDQRILAKNYLKSKI